jgi:four helix bundle protein
MEQIIKNKKTENIKQKTSNNITVRKADELAKLVYELSRNFPKDEIFGLTNQLRRAVLSVPLNIIEGYARSSSKSYRQFLDIAYGSLKETKYLLYFACNERYLSKSDYERAIQLADEVGKIIWAVRKSIVQKTNNK